MELRGLAKQGKQQLGESGPAWRLRLWEDGADKTELSPSETEQLAHVATVPSLRQRLRTSPQAGNRALITWLVAPANPVGQCWRSRRA